MATLAAMKTHVKKLRPKYLVSCPFSWKNPNLHSWYSLSVKIPKNIIHIFLPQYMTRLSIHATRGLKMDGSVWEKSEYPISRGGFLLSVFFLSTLFSSTLFAR